MSIPTSRPRPVSSPHAGVARRTLLAVMVAGIAMPRLAFAQGAAEGARTFIDKLAEEALAIIRSSGTATEERRKRFNDLFLLAFDVTAIGRFVLGRHWSRLKPEEQEKFLKVMGEYVAGIYAAQFADYKGYAFRTTGARGTGEGEALVPAQIDREGQQPIRMEFRVRQAESPKIIDVAVENVSLILTKRDEFSPTLNREGVDGVIKRMQAVIDNTARG
jgi:phospholipid transport system substrate-binding protein